MIGMASEESAMKTTNEAALIVGWIPKRRVSSGASKLAKPFPPVIDASARPIFAALQPCSCMRATERRALEPVNMYPTTNVDAACVRNCGERSARITC